MIQFSIAWENEQIEKCEEKKNGPLLNDPLLNDPS